MNFRSGVQMPEKSTLPSAVRGVGAGGAVRFGVFSASPCPSARAGTITHDIAMTIATMSD